MIIALWTSLVILTIVVYYLIKKVNKIDDDINNLYYRQFLAATDIINLGNRLMDRRLYEGLDVTLSLNPKMLIIKCDNCYETVMTNPPESYGQIENELVAFKNTHRCEDG